jgi:ABC-type bacteriocin/lantibiotic exporter with double-glycine peptidase domain
MYTNQGVTVRTLKNFPLFGQLDNKFDPYGSCNVTCIAMCLYYFGIRGDGNGQLEDQINLALKRKGLSRHNPYHLQQIANEYGARLKPPIVDVFAEDAILNDIKLNIDAAFPCVVHGYFTRSGHIVCVTGYDDSTNQVRIHDPYGEWWPNGYDTSAPKVYWLSYRRFLQLTDDNGIWTHFFSRERQQQPQQQ